MIVGKEHGHVWTALQDKTFAPIERLYLIHSPDQKKSADIPKPIPFKKYAQKLKKEIEKQSERMINPIQVFLKSLTSKGAFDKQETIKVITEIINDEMPSLGTQKQIAINITGGTNMTAVGSIIAAYTYQTEAYYVIDTRYSWNKKLATKISTIPIPNPKEKLILDDDDRNILYEIENNTFVWNGTKSGKETSKNINDNLEGMIPTLTEIKYNIDASINGSQWMKKQSIFGAIEQRKLTSIFDTTAKSDHPSWIKYNKENKLIHPNTFRRKLTKLEERGMIESKKGTPSLAIPKSKKQFDTKITYAYYRINAKENLIIITDTGRAQLSIRQP